VRSLQLTPKTLEIPASLQAADAVLRRAGGPIEDLAWSVLRDETNLTRIETVKKTAGLEGDEMERVLIWHAASLAKLQTESLPIDKSVRARLDQDLLNLATSNKSLLAGSYGFIRAAKIATLRRFPAGPMEWEVSGIPLSYFLRARPAATARLAAFVISKMEGRGPCFFMHVAPVPRSRALSIPKEVMRSYYQMARSMEYQPDIRGLLAHAWFHDPAAVRDYPQLEALNRPYVNHGGLITLLDPAPPSSGVLEGNSQRKEDYLAGKIQYRYGLAAWPRAAAIRWADEHPEFGQ